MIRLLALFSFCLLLVSCDGKEESQTQAEPVIKITVPNIPERRPELKLTATGFNSLANWKNDNILEALDGFKASCKKVLSEKNRYLSNAEFKIPTDLYQLACTRLLSSDITSAVEFRYFLENNFTPWLVTVDGADQGKFTSYYEAAINASTRQTPIYKFPIYGRPRDLIEFNPRDFDPSLPDRRLVGRIRDQKLIPYYTREEIERNKITAPIILWGDSNVDINIMQIQGSAVATLPDGHKLRVSYADNNGHPFKGIGSILLEKGYIKPGEASMGNIKKWLKQHPEIAEKELQSNKRFIFHRISTADGPIGAHGVPLHAGRSLAVDRRYIPLGSLLWLETTGPDHEKIEKLVIAQDIGSAIKGPIRGDYFWGSGNDEVLEKAGRMNSQGRYFLLLPNGYTPAEAKQ